jgi:endonuclease/exonuclease/phosphatase family metal-dependent hydrolase
MALWIVLALLSVLILPIPFAPAAEPVRPLRVLTYNVLHGGPASGFMLDDTHLESRLDMAMREIEALQPDIIALQEVSKSRQYGDVAQKIASRLGLHMVSGFATERLTKVWPLDSLIVGALGFNEGSAILSRFPILASERVDLPRCQSFLDPRILLRAEVSTPWGPLQVYSVHASREGCQAAHVAKVVQEHQSGRPALVMGDFNATESSPGIVTLTEQSGFVDLFRTVNPSLPGFTVWQRITEERPTVFRRVDYIFFVEGSDVTAPAAIPTSAAPRPLSRLVLDHPGRLADGTTLWPSDHYGVFAEVCPSSCLRPSTEKRRALRSFQGYERGIGE